MVSDGLLRSFTHTVVEAQNLDGDAKADLSHVTATMNVASATKNDVEPHYSPLATVSSNVHKQHLDSTLPRNTNAQLYH